MKLDKKPDFIVEQRMTFNAITEIDNAYLQKWVDAGAIVTVTDGDFWIVTNLGQLLFKIHDESMHLECISVADVDRGQGNGTKLMENVVMASDESGIPVSLKVANVTGNGYMMMQHPVISLGMSKKNKIPVRSLPKWYEKFGFKRTEEYTQKNKAMIYEPNK